MIAGLSSASRAGLTTDDAETSALRPSIRSLSATCFMKVPKFANMLPIVSWLLWYALGLNVRGAGSGLGVVDSGIGWTISLKSDHASDHSDSSTVCCLA